MNKLDIKKNLFSLLEDVFELNETKPNENLKMGDIADWDSIGHIRLMLAVEAEFKVKIPFEKARELHRIKSILEYLEHELFS